jgi:hypothetical protein
VHYNLSSPSLIQDSKDVIPPSPPLAEPTRGVEAILLVEDEAPLRKAVVHHGILERGTAFLQKPFSAAVLARKVREVLDNSESRIS